MVGLHVQPAVSVGFQRRSTASRSAWVVRNTACGRSRWWPLKFLRPFFFSMRQPGFVVIQAPTAGLQPGVSARTCSDTDAVPSTFCVSSEDDRAVVVFPHGCIRELRRRPLGEFSSMATGRRVKSLSHGKVCGRRGPVWVHIEIGRFCVFGLGEIPGPQRESPPLLGLPCRRCHHRGPFVSSE